MKRFIKVQATECGPGGTITTRGVAVVPHTLFIHIDLIGAIDEKSKEVYGKVHPLNVGGRFFTNLKLSDKINFEEDL